MTPEVLWKRYAAIWSLGTDMRTGELADCLADDATYCDPNGLIAGRNALSIYMENFQQSAPGMSFQINNVLHHHDRTLANWTLQNPEGKPVSSGTSFGLLAEDGRMKTITGFFHPSAKA